MTYNAAVPARTDKALRPLSLSDFHGQPAISDQLGLFMQAAKQRGETLEHALLFGPPGLGKTTLANIIANEMGGEFVTTSGPLLQKPLDLVPLLVNMEKGGVLFIDEIHRMTIQAEEILYSAMEDGFIDILTDEAEKKAIRITLEPFTLVGATTRSGMLSAPLRDRFGMTFRLQYYSAQDLAQVVREAGGIIGFPLSLGAAELIAKRSRGTPRVALRLIRRVRDIVEAQQSDATDLDVIEKSLSMLGIKEHGLNDLDRQYIELLANTFSGGPVGINTLSASLSEDIDTLEDAVEPFLIQEGFIARTPKGRIMLDAGRLYLGIN